jgi:chromosome partitioning protein
MTLATAPAPSLLPDDQVERLGRRISFNNNKGGVGKTMATLVLGAALARRGRRVLLVDMEPQGNLTRRAAVSDLHTTPTIGEVLRDKQKGGAAAAIRPCGWDVPEAQLIDVIPATLELAERDLEAAQPGSFNRLARVLYGVTDAYDYTLIDCRPTLGHLEQMVTRALDGDTDGYYLVVEAGHDAISGAYRVTQEIGTWADDMDVRALPLGVIVNMYDGRTRLHKGLISALEQSLAQPDGRVIPVLEPYIRDAVRIAEVQHLALPPSADKRLEHEGHIAVFDALAEVIDQP